MKFLIINGPNLNMLGIREKNIYGSETLKDLKRLVREHCRKIGAKAVFYQSNHEGDLVTAIQRARGRFDGIVINPAAYTHTSVAIADAVKAISPLPVAEVHISDVNSREEFRKISYIRDVAAVTISGKGFDGYTEAVDYLVGLCGTGNK